MDIVPIRSDERLDALDVVRGVALCGILLMNIPAMGDTWDWELPLGHPSLFDPSWRIWIVQKLFFEGSMRGLFTLLFGAGVLFITRRAAGPDGPVAVADVYLRRCLGLMAFGLVNVLVLLWPGDIVFLYGMAGVFLFPFRRCRPGTLIALGLAVLLAMVAANAALRAPKLLHMYEAEQALVAQAHGATLSKAQMEAIKDREEALKEARPDADSLAKEANTRLGGLPGLVGWSAAAWSEAYFTPGGMTYALESIAFMLLGMGLFKLGFLSGSRPLGEYAVMAAIGFAFALAIRGVQAWLTWQDADELKAMFGLARVLTYELGRLPLTLGWLGLIVCLWKALPKRVFAPLRAMGRLALTNYLGQSLLTSILFYGLGLYGKLNWAELWGLAAGIWIVQSIFSLAWLRAFQIGPVEWALRYIAYRRAPPLRRAIGPAVVEG
jgi:uncharacterized protein